LHLGEVQRRDLLNLIGDIHIPQAVDAELSLLDEEWARRRPSWVRVDTLASSYLEEAVLWHRSGILDSGEAEATALAQQLDAGWLLTDDAAARVFAQTKDLEAHGSLGIVLWSVAVGYLQRDKGEMILDHLAQTSLWISNAVLLEAKEALRKL
jgi:predicted nucleic acid-binding protein